MPDWIETELKLLLRDEAAFERVARAVGSPTGVRQDNAFFEDDAGRVRAARIGVRLRAEGDTRRLTLKGDVAEGGAGGGEGAVAHRIELEAEMTPAEFEAAFRDGLELAPWLDRFAAQAGPAPLPPALSRFLDALRQATGGERLRCRARFVNARALGRLALADAEGPLALELALDRTELPGGRVDYELEVELGPAVAADPAGAARIERALRRWLETLGAGDVRPAPSKLARLHAALAPID